MKTILFVTNFLLFSIVCVAQCDTIPISVTIKVKKSYQVKIDKKVEWIKVGIKFHKYKVDTDSVKQDWYDVAVEIKNTSDTIVRIWMMTCDWERNFNVNNNYIKIQPKRNGCDANFPYPIKFEPGEVKIYETSLRKSIEFDYPYYEQGRMGIVEETKLGLIILEVMGNNYVRTKINYDRDMNDKSAWKIVWSNPLNLLTKKQYNPNWFQELAKLPCN